MTDKNAGNEIKDIAEIMDGLIEDTSVPRNIRKVVDDAKQRILAEEEVAVKTTAAIYLLDDISNDINMPAHARTEIWTLISELETVREKYK